MFERIRLWWLKRRCDHKWIGIGTDIEGVTLGLGGFARQFKVTSCCARCGLMKSEGGLLLPMAERMDNVPRRADGWPLNADGTQMPMARHYAPLTFWMPTTPYELPDWA